MPARQKPAGMFICDCESQIAHATVYLTWLHTHDVTQLIKDENSAIRVTKATMLLQIAAALEDEEFRIPATKYLEGLYREYDGEFGPVVKPFWEW